MKKLVVQEKYDGKKLVNFLLSEFNNLKQSTIFKALRKKDIIVNEKRINDNIILHTGDLITIYITDKLLYGDYLNLNIVYEDDNILIINKPAGIAVTDSSLKEKTLTNLVQDYCKSAMPCHRLDRNTSGLTLFAKNKVALNILLEKFKSREIDKYYICIVFGIPKIKTAILTDFLFKDNKKSKVYISNIEKIGYSKIITKYTVLNENKTKNISLLDIKLETGRTHQIRAHLAYNGYPIIGDSKYGINEVNKKFNAKYQYLTSYKLKFNFIKDSGILNYLNGKEFSIPYSNYIEIIKNKPV